MRKFWRRTALCLILLMLAALAGACTGGKTSAPQTAPADESVTEEAEPAAPETPAAPKEESPDMEEDRTADNVLRLYVSTDGDDEAEGTAEAPLATLDGAKKKLQSLTFDQAEVVFAGGTYYFPETVRFTARDAKNVTYRAAEGEEVVFTGAVSLTGAWDGTETVNGRTAWVKTLDDVEEYGEINAMFDAEGFLTNARWPTEGYLYAEAGGRPQNPSNPTYNRNLSLFGKTGDLPDLSGENLRHAYLRIYHYWAEELSPVQSWDAASGELVTRYPTSNTTSAGDAYCLENIRCGLDDPGEWYFDYTASKLYYLPRDGETQESTPLWLGHTVTLMNFIGAMNLEFKDITFARTGWKFEQLPSSQAAYGASACLEVIRGRKIDFTSCRFRAIGTTCVNYGGYENQTLDCTVRGCLFENIGMHAVAITGKNEQGSQAKGITVDDCCISGYGKVRLFAVAILQTHASDCTISHNEIHDGSYSAISAGWVWGYSGTVYENNRITDNLIYRIGHAPLSDMGGIYTLGSQKNSVISGNVIFDVCAGDDATTYGGWGIYPDEGSTGFTISGNTVYDCGSQGFHQHYGKDNLVANNIFAFNEEGQVRSSRTESHNQLNLNGNILAGRNQLMYQQVEQGRFADSGNVYFDYAAETGTVYSGDNRNAASDGNYHTKAMQRIGYYRDGVFADPCFTDPDHRNFTFRSTAVCESIGFEPIDNRSVGSGTYASALLLNDLAQPLERYPEALVTAWQTAAEAFRARRTDESIRSLREAHDRLHAFDEYAGCVIPDDLLTGGEPADAYRNALDAVWKAAESGDFAPAGNALKEAYAAGTAAGCTVIFDFGDGRQEKETAAFGDVMDAPVPEYGDSVFTGWMLEDGTPAPEKLTAGFGNVTLTAGRTSAHTLTFAESKEESRKVGSGIPLGELPVLTADGKVFCGWSLTADGSTAVTAETLMPEADTVLTPIWRGACVLHFAVGSFKTITVPEGTPVGKLPVLSSRGKRFAEWNTAEDGSGTSFTEQTVAVAGEFTLYAVTVPCRQILFDNCFDLAAVGNYANGNDSAGHETDAIAGTVSFDKTGSNSFLSVPQKKMRLTAGHSYKVYYTFTENGEETGSTRMTVMPYDKSGNWGSDYYVEDAGPGSTFTVTEPYTNVALRPGAGGSAVTGARIVYQGIAVQDVTDVKTPPRNENGEIEFTRSVDVGTSAGTLPTIERQGYAFLGWNTAEDGSGDWWTAETVMPDRNISLWPVWEKE